MKKHPDPARHTCAHCGDVFLSIHPGRQFCSVKCGRAALAANQIHLIPTGGHPY
jgi:ribosomal protein S27AE